MYMYYIRVDIYICLEYMICFDYISKWGNMVGLDAFH